MQNDDKQRPGQPSIYTHLPDSVPPEDVKKIVGDAVPHGADYNSPPPAGASKSMGSGLDNSVGGPGLGVDPVGRGIAATIRDLDSRADDRHMGHSASNRVSNSAGAQGNLQQGAAGSGGSGGAPSASDEQAQGNRQQGKQQEGKQQEGNRQEGNRQEGNRQEGNRQEGNRQEGNRQEGNRQEGNRQEGKRQDGNAGQATPGNAQRDQGSGGGGGARSEGLLPGQDSGDGRFNVAEEVSLDQQSDDARRVGSFDETTKGAHGDKLAEAVARSLGKGSDKH
jgi:hypothetical protein